MENVWKLSFHLVDLCLYCSVLYASNAHTAISFVVAAL